MSQNKSYLLYSVAFRYFVAVAEEGSIRGAARKLNVVSSAVNRQILNLEQNLDIQLFERVGRGLRLSEAGSVLLGHAKKVLNDLDSAIDALDDLSALKRGIVNIASVESVADSILPNVVTSFQEKYPGIEINIQVMSSTDASRAVIKAESHLALTFNPPVQKSLEFVRTYDLPVGIVVSSSHPLASRKSCKLSDCLKYPLAMPTEQLSIGKTINRLMLKEDHVVGTVIRSNSLRFMRQLILEGNYVAFQTILGLERKRLSGDLKFIRMEVPEGSVEALVLLKNASHGLSMAPQAFINHVVKVLDDIYPV